MAENITIEIFHSVNDAVLELFKNLNQQIYAPEALSFKKSESSNLKYLLHGIVVFKNGEPAGRACFYYNPHLLYGNLKSLLIGNFETVRDEAVASCIFSHAEGLARAKNLSFIIGPLNGSTWDAHRLMLDAGPPLFFTESPTPVSYNQLFLTNGFTAISHYTSAIATNLFFDAKAFQDMQQQMESANMRMREINLKHFEAELVNIHALCSAGFQHNFLYTPISQHEFMERYRPLKSFIDPTFVLLAENETGELKGLYLCLPDWNNNVQKRLIIKTIVKHPQCGHKGLMAWMGAEIYRLAHAHNYEAVIHAFMQGAARSNRLSDSFGGTVYRRYALYGKAIH